MSIKHGLLALLERGPATATSCGRSSTRATGATWPLNVGQVYTTLDRLERDGLVAQDGEPDADGRIAYRITDAGRAELRRLVHLPGQRARPRPATSWPSSSRWRSPRRRRRASPSCRPSARRP